MKQEKKSNKEVKTEKVKQSTSPLDSLVQVEKLEQEVFTGKEDEDVDDDHLN